MGTYLLVLHLERPGRIRVGKLGTTLFNAGFYGYVGSALGPGGLPGRIGRHLKTQKSCHWHIDYLRRKSRLTDIGYVVSPDRREHGWARVLMEMRGVAVPMPGFGSSDCHCLSHLVYFGWMPAITEFIKQAEALFPSDPKIQFVSAKGLS